MAKKFRESAETSRSDLYPWLRLLELEVKPTERPALPRGRGRPPNPFPRKAVHVTLTQDELSALDELADLLSERFETGLHRGHVISFLTFYLQSRLLQGKDVRLPAEVKSLMDLAKYLDRERD
jgi:hypothetical protein